MTLIDNQLLQQFEQQVNNTSFQLAALEFLQAVGISVEIFGTIPEQGATLLIPNHPSGIDGMVLFAAVNRLGFYQVGLAVHRLANESVNKKILPMYRLQKMRDFLPNLFASSLQSHVLDDAIKIRRKNRQSIVDAARLVSEGNAVAMFPEGVVGKQPKQGTWKPGIGFLAKKIINPNTQVIFVKLVGTHSHDLLRLLRPYLRKMLFPEIHVTVTFAEPILLSNLIDQKQNNRNITHSLAEAYTTVFGQ